MSQSRKHRRRRRPHPFGFGATGQHPEGKIREDDAGELRFGITHHGGEVILDFGTDVRWLGMPPALARQLGELLIEHAGEVEQEVKEHGH